MQQFRSEARPWSDAARKFFPLGGCPFVDVRNPSAENENVRTAARTPRGDSAGASRCGGRLVFAAGLNGILMAFQRIAIVGPTDCGKTTLGLSLVRQYLRRKIPVLACDWNTRWPAAFQTADVDALTAYAKIAWGCCLVVDELGKKVRTSDSADWLFTSSRHREHDLLALLHDGVQLTPLMRHQFSAICLFASPPEVCDMWRGEFNEPGLLGAGALRQHEFILKRRFQPLGEAQRLTLGT
jgi:hypothetical protein